MTSLSVRLSALAAMTACSLACSAAPADLPISEPRPPASTAPLGVVLTAARYGEVELETEAGAACSLAIDVERGLFGEGPPSHLEGTADAQGRLRWIYPAPLVPAGTGRLRVRCERAGRASEATAEFAVPATALDPKYLRVRIEPLDVAADWAGIDSRPDASLVPARDAAVALLRSMLEKRWRAATRGLGSLELVESSADIVVHVIPGRGVDEHRVAADGTQRVDLPVVNESGPLSAALVVSGALHELGHIWCCYADGADSAGHWAAEVPDARFSRVNRFGLMGATLHCLRYVPTDRERCPDRFSDREMRVLGFRDFPPPDACEGERASLEDQVVTMRRELDDLGAQIAALRAQLPRTPGGPPVTRLVPSGATPRPVSSAEALRERIAELMRAYDERSDALKALVTKLIELPSC